jgi:Tfp pilus assembly protein PilO
MNQTKLIVGLGEASWSKILVIGLLLAGLYYLAMYDNGAALRAALESSTHQLADTTKKLRETKKALDDAARFEKDVIAQEQNFKKVTEFMPADINAAELNQILTRQATLAGVKIMKLDPQAGDQRIDFYEMTRMKVVVQGSFAQILSFMSNLTKVPKLLTFDDLELAMIPAGDPEQPKINGTGTLVAYRYIPEAAPEKTAAPGGAKNATK